MCASKTPGPRLASLASFARFARFASLVRWPLLALLTGTLLLPPAWGQQTPSREQEQLRRLRQQLQQLQQQQTTDQEAARRATAEQTAAQAKLLSTQGEHKRLRAALAAQTQATAEAQQALAALRTELEALRQASEAQRADLASSQQALAQLRAENAQLQRNVANRLATHADLDARHRSQAQGLQTCMANNQALHALGLELLQRYADKGLTEVLAHNEPFLQTRRVALDNLVQGYQDKLDQQALKAPAPAASSSTREAARAAP